MQTSSRFMKLVRGVFLVVVVVPTGSAVIHGCSNDDEITNCIVWPDPAVANADPKVCPIAAEAENNYFPKFTVTSDGTLSKGHCCYTMVPYGESDQGCTSLGSIISETPSKDDAQK